MSDSGPTAPRLRANNVAMRWALFIALSVVAIAYFAMPVRAQDSCEAWKAEMWEDEGGSVLTAANCARDFPEAYLILTCHEGRILVRYDLAYGAERSPELAEIRELVFVAGENADTFEVQYQEMDGLFAADMPADAYFPELLRTGGDLLIGDADAFYPQRTISLDGAGDAVDAILAGC